MRWRPHIKIVIVQDWMLNGQATHDLIVVATPAKTTHFISIESRRDTLAWWTVDNITADQLNQIPLTLP